MATVGAEKFGNSHLSSKYGDSLLARDGNGDSFGETTIDYEGSAGDMKAMFALQENEIMRRAVNSTEPVPGDYNLLRLLSIDERILNGDQFLGSEFDPETPIITTEVEVLEIGPVLTWGELEGMSTQEAHTCLQELIGKVIDYQSGYSLSSTDSRQGSESHRLVPA